MARGYCYCRLAFTYCQASILPLTSVMSLPYRKVVFGFKQTNYHPLRNLFVPFVFRVVRKNFFPAKGGLYGIS
jgi:hypothetical protein